MRTTQSLLVICGLVCGSEMAARADESATLDITGLRIQNNNNQSRTSMPDTVSPANNYTVTNQNVMARGQGGVLGLTFPNPTPIQTILDTLSPGTIWPTTAEAPNPDGTHPFTISDETISGTSVLGGITITFSATITAGIGANDAMFYNITSVTISPSILVGSLVFTSGTFTVTRNPLPTCDSIDFNRDTLFPDTQDVIDFLAVFAGEPCPTPSCGDLDYNNDGLFPDVDDLNALLRVFGGGAC